MPDLTVVIPAYNEADEIAGTIEAMADASPAGTRIIVVDDGSTDGTFEAVQKLGTTADVIAIAHAGASAARNAGAALAETRFLAFADAHVKPSADWAEPLLAVFDSFREVGAVGPVFYSLEDDADDPAAGAGMALDTWWPIIEMRWLEVPAQPTPVPIITAACQLWERETFAKLGGYDDDFAPIGLEDTELALRAWRSGLTNVATPFARFGHQFKSDWDEHPSVDVIANELRLAVLHWSPARLADALRLIAHWEDFDAWVARAFTPSTLAKRAEYAGNGYRDADEWLALSVTPENWTAETVAAQAVTDA